MTYTIVIPDLHGMSYLLDAALKKIEESKLEVSKIVFTGDYIDRGKDSAGVVATVKKLVQDGKAIALKGNHEDMMASSFDFWGDYSTHLYPWWMPNGGDVTLDSYGYDMEWAYGDSLWMKQLPLYCLDEHRIYVHGYAPVTCEDPEKFNGESVMWDRYEKIEDIGWFGRHVVHGHTPRKQPELLTNRTNLDTRAYETGLLHVGVFEDSIGGGPVEVWEITGEI